MKEQERKERRDPAKARGRDICARETCGHERAFHDPCAKCAATETPCPSFMEAAGTSD